MRRLVTLVVAARALAPSHLTPAQMKRYAKVEAQLRDEPRSTPVLVDGNNVRATLGWTRTTAEVQALVDDWAVATSRRCVTCWDYGDAFAASETSGGAAVFSGRDVLADDALAQAIACLDCACVLVTSDTNLLARCRAQRSDVVSLRSQDFGWVLEASSDAWGDRRPSRAGESSRTRKREARALFDALRGGAAGDSGDAVARFVRWVSDGRPGLTEKATRRGNVLFEVSDAAPGPGAPPTRRARRGDELRHALDAIDAYRRPRDLVVVEGSHDAAAVVRALPGASTFVLNGSSLGPTKAEALAERAAATRAAGARVVVLADPDFTGLSIRRAVDRALSEVDGTRHAFVPAADATLLGRGGRSNKRAGSVGVEHASPEAIVDALRAARPVSPGRAVFSRDDLVAWGLADGPGSEDLRAAVALRLGFGLCSAKSFLRLANVYSFSRGDVEGALREEEDTVVRPFGGASVARDRVPKGGVSEGARVALRLDDGDWCEGVVTSRVASGQNRGHARVRCEGRSPNVVRDLARRSYGRDWVLLRP